MSCAFFGTAAEDTYSVAPSDGTARSTGTPAFFHMKPRAAHMIVSHTSPLFSAAASASLLGYTFAPSPFSSRSFALPGS